MLIVKKNINGILRYIKPIPIIKFLIFISIVILIFTLDITYLINFAHDDSFYYLKTALNFSQGNGSTFDGINKTNGYHPLYFWILSIYFFILNLFLDTNPEMLFRFVCLLHLLFIYIIVSIVNKIINIHFDNDKSYFLQKLLIFTLLFGLILIRDVGTEAHLTVVLIFSIYYLLVKKESYKFKHILFLSTLVFFILLSRTDLVLSLFIPLLIYKIFTKGVKEVFSKYFIFFVFASLSVFSTLLYNYLIAGSILSVSSLIANTFPNIVLMDNLTSLITNFGDYITFLKFITLLVLLIISIYLFNKNKKNVKNDRYLLTILLAAGSLLFCFQHLLFNRYGLRSWYMVIPSCSIILLTINIFPKIKKEYFIKLFTILILFVVISYFIAIRLFNNKFKYVYKYSKEIEKITSENDKIFQIDFSGIVSFFSSRKIINGDGLINSYEYYQYLKKNNISDYLKKLDVKYYSFFVWRNFKEDSEYIYDFSYENFSDGLFFKIKKDNIVLKYPYNYQLLLVTDIGNWYLVKLSF